MSSKLMNDRWRRGLAIWFQNETHITHAARYSCKFIMEQYRIYNYIFNVKQLLVRGDMQLDSIISLRERFSLSNCLHTLHALTDNTLRQ